MADHRERSAAIILVAVWASGCSGESGPQAPQYVPSTTAAPAATPRGESTLTAYVVDDEGRPAAGVRIEAAMGWATLQSAVTPATGIVTLEHLPNEVTIFVHAQWGEPIRRTVSIAPMSTAFVTLTIEPRRGHSAALLPVEIAAGSLSADRRELTLEVTAVAPRSTPFPLAGYGTSPTTPALALELAGRECWVWLDAKRTSPSCGEPWGASPYSATVERFEYRSPANAQPTTTATPPASALLVIEQSERTRWTDPYVRRTSAAKLFIARAMAGTVPKHLSVAGFAGSSPPTAVAALPETPLWTPLPPGARFTQDVNMLNAAVGTLAPLIGGSSPMPEALETAMTLAAAEAPGGSRSVVTLFADDRNGNDRSEAVPTDNDLAALARHRAAAHAEIVFVASGDPQPNDALARMAAALDASTVFMVGSWTNGSYGALDLAADLLERVPLPSLSASLRLRADAAHRFESGATLRGTVLVEYDSCPMGCPEIVMPFAVTIP